MISSLTVTHSFSCVYGGLRLLCVCVWFRAITVSMHSVKQLTVLKRGLDMAQDLTQSAIDMLDDILDIQTLTVDALSRMGRETESFCPSQRQLICPSSQESPTINNCSLIARSTTSSSGGRGLSDSSFSTTSTMRRHTVALQDNIFLFLCYL